MSVSSKTKQNFIAWAIVAIIGLLGLNAYQWFVNSQLKTQNSVQQTNMIELEKIHAELDQDYESALANLEEMRGDNKELNDLIDSQKKELAEQKNKISNLIWTKRELTKAREEIKVLNAKAAEYLAQITRLTTENDSLMVSNNQLLGQNNSLTAEVNAQMQANEELSMAKSALTSEKEKLASTNEKLSSKVDMANAIKINYLEVSGFSVRKDGKLKQKSRAKSIDLLRTCFTTETNMVTPAGEKEFFVRIISPEGETVAVENSGSGVITNKLENTQVRYTTSGTINYNNEDTNACIDWMLPEKLAQGNYQIEMYNNGFLCGTGSFKLK
jgi:hypothetical protein